MKRRDVLKLPASTGAAAFLPSAGKSFVACSEIQQNQILSNLEAGMEPSSAPGANFFKLAKRLTAQIYYAAQAGNAELNKGGRVPESFACKHGSHA